jgi:hypothetical protein
MSEMQLFGVKCHYLLFPVFMISSGAKGVGESC